MLRADICVSSALGISRSKAAAMIERAEILINSKLALKPAQLVRTDSEVKATSSIYVSRAALKLRGYLLETGLKIDGARALDVGCAAGGFMQILLEFGASSVLGVDVGRGQISQKILQDPRAKVFEETDIRDFQSEVKFDLITCDASFIGAGLLLPAISELASKECSLILLFKPQFEVGLKAKRSKKGVVRDVKAIANAQKSLLLNASALGWVLADTRASVLSGKEGNVEYFYHFKRSKV